MMSISRDNVEILDFNISSFDEVEIIKEDN